MTVSTLLIFMKRHRVVDIGSHHPHQVDFIVATQFLLLFSNWYLRTSEQPNWNRYFECECTIKERLIASIRQQVKWTTFNKFILYMGKCQLLKIWNVPLHRQSIRSAICLFTCSLILLFFCCFSHLLSTEIRFAIKYCYKCLETY